MSRKSSLSIAILAAAVCFSAVHVSQAQDSERGERGQRGERGGRGGGRFGRGGAGGGMFGGGMFGGPMNEFAMLGIPAVQKDLDLSEGQKESAEKLVASYRDDQQAARENSGFDFGALRDLSQEERQEKMAEFGKKQAESNRKLDEKYQPKLAETLKPEQLKRLKQITLQAAGVQALRSEDVAKTLKLTDEQQEQIAKALQGGFGGGRGGFARRGRDDGGEGGQGDFQARMEEMRKAAEERNAKALAVLSEEQQKEFEELKGKPFDMAQLRPRGFGGGRGGREGGGRGRESTGRERPPM
ncbi:MAG TPA: hypothetical protein VHC19_03690 [Pirellulales bacterium]|nr:hypothetical protein [Pirellulales bacterium]